MSDEKEALILRRALLVAAVSIIIFIIIASRGRKGQVHVAAQSQAPTQEDELAEAPEQEWSVSDYSHAPSTPVQPSGASVEPDGQYGNTDFRGSSDADQYEQVKMLRNDAFEAAKLPEEERSSLVLSEEEVNQLAKSGDMIY